MCSPPNWLGLVSRGLGLLHRQGGGGTGHHLILQQALGFG